MSLLDDLRREGRETAIIGLGKSGVAAGTAAARHGVPVYASEIRDSATTQGVGRRRLRAAGAEVELGAHDLGAHCAGRHGHRGAGSSAGGAADPSRARSRRSPSSRKWISASPRCPATRFVAPDRAPTGRPRPRRSWRTSWRRPGSMPWRPATSGCRSARWRAAPRRPAWLALELSSFQLHDMPAREAAGRACCSTSRPTTSTGTTRSTSTTATRRCSFGTRTPASVWVSNADDPAVQGIMADVPGRHLRFSTTRRADGWYDRARWLAHAGRSDRLLERGPAAAAGRPQHRERARGRAHRRASWAAHSRRWPRA